MSRIVRLHFLPLSSYRCSSHTGPLAVTGTCRLCTCPRALVLAVPSICSTLSPDVSVALFQTSFQSLLQSHLSTLPYLCYDFKYLWLKLYLKSICIFKIDFFVPVRPMSTGLFFFFFFLLSLSTFSSQCIAVEGIKKWILPQILLMC